MSPSRTSFVLLGITACTVLTLVLYTNDTHAVRYEPPAEFTFFDENGEVENRCRFAFDTYLLQGDAWKRRASDFAQEALTRAADNLMEQWMCQIPETKKEFKIFGNGVSIDLFPHQDCVYNSDSNLQGIFQDAALRNLYYDSIARCTSRTVLDDLIDKMLRIAREGGPDGGPAWPESYEKVIANSEARGRAVARNLFGNTQYCPWFQQDMELLFQFDPENAGSVPDGSESGSDPYTQRAQCSFPPETSLEEIERIPGILSILKQPQNNIHGAYQEAAREMAYQIEKQREADLTELKANDGYWSLREECAPENQDDQGECLEKGDATTPGGNVKASVDAATQADLQVIIDSDVMGSLIGDMRWRVLGRIQDLTAPSIQTQFQLDPAQRRYFEDVTAPEVSPPSAACTQTPGAAGYCGMPSQDTCTCVHKATVDACEGGTNGDAYKRAEAIDITVDSIRGSIGAVDARRTPQAPLSTVAAGTRFVQDVCLEMFGANLHYDDCHPYVHTSGEVLLVYRYGESDLLIDVITAAGKPRVNGATAKYYCDSI